MKRAIWKLGALGALAALTLAGPARAEAPLFDAYNTGINVSGTTDQSYQFLSLGTTTPTAASLLDAISNGAWQNAHIQADTSIFPTGSWDTDGNGSKWVAPKDSYSYQSPNYGTVRQGDPEGYYLFKTTFNLAEQDVQGASLVGSWLSDNEGVAIYLNPAQDSMGEASYVGGKPGDLGYGAAMGTYRFDIATNFTAGTNSLYFLVHNDAANRWWTDEANPAGVRVEYTVDPPVTAPVPEPAFLQLGMLLASGAVMTLRLKRERGA